MATWESASMAIAGSSPMFHARSRPTARDYEDEDRSHHPRRSNNRDLVRDHGLESGRNSLNGLDDFFRAPRASVSSVCGQEESYNSVSTYGRESFSSAFDESLIGRTTPNRGSVSSDNTEISLAKKATDKSDGSTRSCDGSNRGWCNFCSDTGHTVADCPWQPNATTINWLDARNAKTPGPEWPGVDFGDEKRFYQEDAIEDPDKEFVLVDSSRSPDLHNPRYISQNFLHDYSMAQERNRGKATLRPSRDNRDDVFYDNTSTGGWISVDPTKSCDSSKVYDEDAIARLQSERNGKFRNLQSNEVGVDPRLGDRNFMFNAQQFIHGHEAEEDQFFDPYPDVDMSRSTDDMSVERTYDGGFESDPCASNRSADGRRHIRGGISRSSDFTGNGHTRTNSATVTIISPSVITFMHPRVPPAKALTNSPAKQPIRLEHRRSQSQGFAPTYPSSPRTEIHRIEANKKQSVDETVGMLPPVIGKRCHKCWGYGHLHAQCPSRNGGANAKNSRDGSWKQCRYCRERGHVFSDCPHAPPNNNLPPSPARITPSSPPKATHHLQ